MQFLFFKKEIYDPFISLVDKPSAGEQIRNTDSCRIRGFLFLIFPRFFRQVQASHLCGPWEHQRSSGDAEGSAAGSGGRVDGHPPDGPLLLLLEALLHDGPRMATVHAGQPSAGEPCFDGSFNRLFFFKKIIKICQFNFQFE